MTVVSTPGVLSSNTQVCGRRAERRALEGHASRLDVGARSLLLVGEAGIGKSTLWRYGLELCRARGALVLQSRPSEEDRHSPGQGLHDLFGGCPTGDQTARLLNADCPVHDRLRLVLQELRRLAADRPVVLAVDDLPWLDEVTLRALRFSLRRLDGASVSLLATGRLSSPLEAHDCVPVPELDCDLDVLAVPPMGRHEIRRLVGSLFPGLSPEVTRRIGETADGNPLLALELARCPTQPGTGGGTASRLLSTLSLRVSGLPGPTLHLARLVAVAGPVPLGVLEAATSSCAAEVEAALVPALERDLLRVEHDFVLRFAHPLIAMALLDGINALDRRALHAALADVMPGLDGRAVHLARATVDPDPAVANLIEEAASRLASCGAQQLAAELLSDSARLTPHDEARVKVRRRLAQLRHTAAAGDLGRARALSDSLLADLPPGPVRAEVVSTWVELERTDAEPFIRQALAQLPDTPDDDATVRLRGRLVGLLGWLLALHLGRIDEGLQHAREALAVGRQYGDRTLMAQTSATVATAALMRGHREDGLIEEAVRLDLDLEGRHLVMWPRVLLGRQQLWDGHLAEARANHEAMHDRSRRLGADFQLGYRRHDLAMVSLAAGDLDEAVEHVERGLEAAAGAGDAEAEVWLAYPGGMGAALRGDARETSVAARRLEMWSARVGERPRSAMAEHVRGTLAASGRRWDAALDHHLTALTVLDRLGVAHPGVVPVLPVAIQLAVLAERADVIAPLCERLGGAVSSPGSPWVEAQAMAARGHLMLVADDPSSLPALADAHARLDHLGYHLDAARLGCSLALAGLRFGRRREVRPALTAAYDLLLRQRILGWVELADELRQRVCGGPDLTRLTVTEKQVATLVADGSRNKEIAARLFVAESTVEAHLTRIYRKLGLRNRTDLTSQVRSGTSG